jgi:hypothetical protein
MSDALKNETGQIRTREEIECLKRDWRTESWDYCELEETEGFEAHHDELKAFRLEIEAEREARYEKERLRETERIQKLANDLGCSTPVAKIIDRLQSEVADLSAEVGRNSDPDTICYRLNRIEGRVFK